MKILDQGSVLLPLEVLLGFENSDCPDAPEIWAEEIRKVEITESEASNLMPSLTLNRESDWEFVPVQKHLPRLLLYLLKQELKMLGLLPHMMDAMMVEELLNYMLQPLSSYTMNLRNEGGRETYRDNHLDRVAADSCYLNLPA